MADRRYYSERAGRGPAAASLPLDDLKRLFADHFSHLESEGYFQESLGYQCVDRGFVSGTTGTDLKAELLLTLNKPQLWPVHATLADWTEDDLFDVIEFAFHHLSKPTERSYHSYYGCGWHCSEFDQAGGRNEFRAWMNRLLQRYDTGFELSAAGDVLALAPSGLDPLLEADVTTFDSENVGARIEAAIHKFRRHRASVADRRDAVRNLADVLEFLRPRIRDVLTTQDESDLFNIANNFGIRHHRPGQKVDYDLPVWLDWIFYYYLATIHAVLRFLERATE